MFEVYRCIGTIFGNPHYLSCGYFQTQREAEVLVETLKTSDFDAFWEQVQ